MVTSDKFLGQLHYYAESFTGMPTRIIAPSTGQQDTLAQTEGFTRIFIPYEVKPTSMQYEEDLGLVVYKGIVALQASAARYNGVPDKETIKEHGRFRAVRAEKELESLDDFLLYADGTTLLQQTYRALELARRVQCINEDYPILGEDMARGFNSIFDGRTLAENHKPTSISSDLDVCIARMYWQRLGIDEGALERICDRIPFSIEGYAEEAYQALLELSGFSDPLETSYEESLERTFDFEKYVRTLCRDTGLPLPFATISGRSARETLKNDIWEEKGDQDRYRENELRLLREREQKLSRLEGKPQKELGMSTREDIDRRIESIRKRRNEIENNAEKVLNEMLGTSYVEALKHQGSSPSTTASLLTVFRDVPFDQLSQLDIPEELKEGKQGQSLFFPEFREGVLVPRAVRVQAYDLRTEQPPTQEYLERRRKLDVEIGRHEKEAEEHNTKIRSDVNYIYDLPELVKKRDKARRKAKRLQTDARRSERIQEALARRELDVDEGLVRKIQREMELIKPEARSIVRRCFEGELDEKAYFEYLLEVEQGGDPIPAFYYQWQRRERDVASVVLFDASHSTNALADGEKTSLDRMKEAAYYLSVGAEALDDDLAVMAYNGKGSSRSRVFLLKDFEESPTRLRGRLEMLRGEQNNRDGSAIRYATHLFGDYPAKTKFLFHMSDMDPSDIEFETPQSAIVTHPYQGENAVEDVVHAFNGARNVGIIPVGIGITKKPVVTPKKPEESPTRKKKMNPAVLAKLKSHAKGRTQEVDLDSRLGKLFGNYYRRVEEPKDLATILREAYLGLSFD